MNTGSDERKHYELAQAVGKLRARGYDMREIGAALVLAGGCILAGCREEEAVKAAIHKAADNIPKDTFNDLR